MATKAKSATTSNRKAIVFVSLVGVLTATTALLLALSPAPLRPEAPAALMNVDAAPADPMEAVFQTDAPIRVGQWNAIVIHVSPAGDATDHFVIGNGPGTHNGEIQMTPSWMQQLSAKTAASHASRDGHAIRICLIGQGSDEPATIAQVQHLWQLVSALQQRLAISTDQVRAPGLRRW